VKTCFQALEAVSLFVESYFAKLWMPQEAAEDLKRGQYG